MNDKFTAKSSIFIDAAPAEVWEALTRPDLIEQYLFGTQVSTDWQVGSPITYKGEWEGKSYEDKGKILEMQPGSLLVSTFWSSLAGLPDLPENYKTVRYELTPERNGTRLAIIQDNNGTEEEAKHSEKNWTTVLEGMKKLLEG